MRRLPGIPAAGLAMLAVSFGGCSTSTLAPMQIVQPSPGLSLTAALDRSSLQPGSSVRLNVELKNTGRDEVLVQGEGRCSPALHTTIWDSGDGVAWAQPLPLCAQPDQPQGPPSVTLAPGGSVSASQCFSLAAGASASGLAGQCAILDLPVGTYRVGGTFRGVSLPRLELVRR